MASKALKKKKEAWTNFWGTSVQLESEFYCSFSFGEVHLFKRWHLWRPVRTLSRENKPNHSRPLKLEHTPIVVWLRYHDINTRPVRNKTQGQETGPPKIFPFLPFIYPGGLSCRVVMMALIWPSVMKLPAGKGLVVLHLIKLYTGYMTSYTCLSASSQTLHNGPVIPNLMQFVNCSILVVCCRSDIRLL